MNAIADVFDVQATVLLIEDDLAFRELCARYLGSDAKYQYVITGVDTAHDALTECEFHQFDCLIVDYRLAEHTGTEILKILKDRLGESLAPSVVLTAEGGEQAAVDAIRAGAYDFLSKRSLTRTALRRAVDNAVEKGRLRRSIINRRRELSESNELLSRRNNEIQRFYHNLSHELKTPLTAVREFISIVNDGLAGSVNDEQRKLLNYALSGCEQLATQFDDLLDLARLETGKISIRYASASLHDVLERCILAAMPFAKSRNVELHLKIADGIPALEMDENRIVQVVSNLINNAIKYNYGGGKVEVIADSNDEKQTIKISVIDSGYGIAEEHLSHIFDRLFQISTPDLLETPSGMGIGLAIASEIVNAHNSRIHVESKLGEGSVFWFELPAIVENCNVLAKSG